MTIHEKLAAKLPELLKDDPTTLDYRVDRSVFTDQEMFELEMKHIFEGNWIYLAHESQIPNHQRLFHHLHGPAADLHRPRQEWRAERLHQCLQPSRRNAVPPQAGNKSSYTCPFHGWTFNNSGKLLKVKDPTRTRAIPTKFNDGKLARPDQAWRGSKAIAASCSAALNPDVVPLAEHLRRGGQDHRHDRGSVAGRHRGRCAALDLCTIRRQLEAADGKRRRRLSRQRGPLELCRDARAIARLRQVDNVRAMSAGGWAKQGGGCYSFENGHLLLWTNWANPEDRPNWEHARRTGSQKFGQARADWMVRKSRNLCLYPNVYLMDQFSSQIRDLPPDRGR